MYGGVIKPLYWESAIGREMIEKRDVLKKSGLNV
jgi:hypothetical protein